MKFTIPVLFLVVYCLQHADGPDGTQTAWHGGHSNFPLDDIFLPAAKDMIHAISEESDNDAEILHSNTRSFLMTKTGFQIFEI
jgi:hypothetical protein